MKMQVHRGKCLDYKGKVIVLFHFSDIRPLQGNPALLDWRCNASVSILWKKKPDLFKFGQLTVIATQGKIPAAMVILAGLGTSEAIDGDLRKEACRIAYTAALKMGAREIAIDGSILIEGPKQITIEDIKNVLESVDKKGSMSVALFPGDRRQRSSSGINKRTVDGAV